MPRRPAGAGVGWRVCRYTSRPARTNSTHPPPESRDRDAPGAISAPGASRSTPNLDLSPRDPQPTHTILKAAVRRRPPQRSATAQPILASMNARPTIAITCSVGDIRSGEWDEHAAYSPIAYVRAVQRAGARAILLVADDAGRRRPAASCSQTLDGVILSGGGSDVAPRRYGQAAAPADRRRGARPRRLRARARPRRARARPAAARHLPRHAAAQRRLRRHAAPAPARRARPRRASRAAGRLRPPRGAHRARLARRDRHGQRDRDGPLAPPPGARRDRRRPARHAAAPTSTTAPRRSRIRAARFLLGVLWHPEEDERSRVVGALVDAARERQRSRRA